MEDLNQEKLEKLLQNIEEHNGKKLVDTVIPTVWGDEIVNFKYTYSNRLPQLKPLGPERDFEFALPDNEILYFYNHLGKPYYEMYEHNSALIALSHYLKDFPANFPPPLLINIDTHNDVYKVDGTANCGNWLITALQLNMFDNQYRAGTKSLLGAGAFWITNNTGRNSLMSEYSEEAIHGSRVHYNAQADYFGQQVSTEVNMTQIPVNAFDKPGVLENFIGQMKDYNTPIVTMVDLDTGNNSDQKDSKGRRLYADVKPVANLANQQWLQRLMAFSDVNMIIHSPGYAPLDYAHQQAVKFRELHLMNYDVPSNIRRQKQRGFMAAVSKLLRR